MKWKVVRFCSMTSIFLHEKCSITVLVEKFTVLLERYINFVQYLGKD